MFVSMRVSLPYFRLMMASTRIRQMKKSTSTCVVVYCGADGEGGGRVQCGTVGHV